MTTDELLAEIDRLKLELATSAHELAREYDRGRTDERRRCVLVMLQARRLDTGWSAAIQEVEESECPSTKR